MKTSGFGWANGKIILIGEHAVVYGQPAIAFPFTGARVKVTIEPHSEMSLVSSYYTGALASAPFELKNIQTLLKELQAYFGSQENLNLRITSTIPSERGMGSSAAVAVALTRAFFDWKKTALSYETLLNFVNHSEEVAHGNPSGIDATATSGSQPLYFVKGQPFEAFPLNLNAYLIVADTGIKGQTRQAVADVGKLVTQQPQVYLPIIKDIGAFVHASRQSIIENQIDELGAYMTATHSLLQQLTVSNDTLDLLVKTALNNGALGAKLTGGGRGGCLIALADSREAAENIAKNLIIQGASQTWIQGLGVFEHV